MNSKIIGIIAIVIILFSINKYNNQNNSASDGVKGSSLDNANFMYREEKFSRWLPRNEYNKKFKNGYFKKHKTYPAYIEMDTLGNKRMIEIPYQPSFYWRVATSRLKESFKKVHIIETLNRGKKLLSLQVTNKDGIDVYAGVWISSGVFEREAKKLQKYGITPPEFLDFRDVE